MENVEDDYESLIENKRQLEIQLEEKNQELYVLKNNISLSSALEIDSAEEIKSRNDEEYKNELELTKKIKNFETTLNTLINESTEKLQENNDLISCLESEKAQLEHTNKVNNQKVKEINKSKLTRQSLVKDDYQHFSDVIETQIVEIEQKISDLNKEKDLKKVLKQKHYGYNCRLEELDKAVETVQYLQDEIRVNKNCVGILKSIPNDPSQQGNSMFAQVKDRFETLKNRVTKLEKDYARMNKTLFLQTGKLKSVQEKTENLCKDLVNINDCGNYLNDDAIRQEINELKEKIENYCDEIEKGVEIEEKNVASCALEFVNNCIKSKREESVIIFKRLNQTLKEHFDVSKELRSESFELNRLKRKVLELNVKNKILESLYIDYARDLSFLINGKIQCKTVLDNSAKNSVSDKENSCVNANWENLEVSLIEFNTVKVLEPNVTTRERSKKYASSREGKVTHIQNFEEICKGDSVKCYEKENICANANLENFEVSLLDFSPVRVLESDCVKTRNVPKIRLSPPEDTITGDSQNFVEMCKSDAVKNYYMLTPVSPQTLDEPVDHIL